MILTLLISFIRAEEIIQQITDIGTYHFSVPPGYYKVECKGAQGGDGYEDALFSSSGGRGAIVSGYMKIDKEINFQVNIGGRGGSCITGGCNGGQNGGGKSGLDLGTSNDGDDGSGGGGGATDLRIGTFSLNERVMVAAGGSGGVSQINGAPGGDLTGYRISSSKNKIASIDTDQNKGNVNGQGGVGVDGSIVAGSGGGGGWRGGKGGDYSYTNFYLSVGDSGSSYISGYTGCIPNSQLVFESGTMISSNTDGQNGNGCFILTEMYKCLDHCADCADSVTCNRCLNGYKYLTAQKKCFDICPSGTYMDATQTKCLDCSLHCDQCSDASVCQKCSANYKLINNECTDDCPIGTYVSSDGAKCLNCVSPCLSCVGTENNCISCKPGFYSLGNQCLLNCDAVNLGKKYGKDEGTNTCKECATKNCANCLESYLICISCVGGYILDDGLMKCISIPTNEFTRSNEFSRSEEFTKSNVFPKADQFSDSFISVHIDSEGGGGIKEGPINKTALISGVSVSVFAIIIAIIVLLILISKRKAKNNQIEDEDEDDFPDSSMETAISIKSSPVSNAAVLSSDYIFPENNIQNEGKNEP